VASDRLSDLVATPIDPNTSKGTFSAIINMGNTDEIAPMALWCKQTFATVVAAYLRQSRLAFCPRIKAIALTQLAFRSRIVLMPPSLLAHNEESDPFAVVHESGSGPQAKFGQVRFSVAFGGQAELASGLVRPICGLPAQHARAALFVRPPDRAVPISVLIEARSR
jgi:hypothetical protein